jgi:hypothetical protein
MSYRCLIFITLLLNIGTFYQCSYNNVNASIIRAAVSDAEREINKNQFDADLNHTWSDGGGPEQSGVVLSDIGKYCSHSHL